MNSKKLHWFLIQLHRSGYLKVPSETELKQALKRGKIPRKKLMLLNGMGPITFRQLLEHLRLEERVTFVDKPPSSPTQYHGL